jgi:dipeptide transport system substrate-binding protein
MTLLRWSVVACLLIAGSMAVQAKTLVFCTEGDPGTISPPIVTSITGVNAVQPMFDTLVSFKPGGSEIVPGLAESWTISPDATEYVFHLRRGVKFHPTPHFTPRRTFNADDVVFSFERQWREDNPFHRPRGASFSYFDDMEMAGLLRSIDKIGDYTVRFRLTRAEAPFLADMAMSFAMIGSAEYADAVLKAGTPDLLDDEPVGTGPFTFESYRKDVAVRYKSFADYWGGQPAIDSLVFSITPNASMRLTKLKANECQVMSFPSPADAGRIEHDPQLTLLRQPGLNIGYMALNASRPPLDDVRVRRAINLAIDKDTLVRTVYGRDGTPAKNPLPPTQWSYNDEIAPYPYDPAMAQRLMVEAGLANGFEVDLWYMPVTRSYNPDSKRLGEMIADDLARIGIRVHLTTAPWAEYRKRLMAGEASLAFFGWTSDNGDPDNFLDLLLGCRDWEPYSNNIAKWCDPAYNQLVTRAKLTSDYAERNHLYHQAQIIFHDEAPWVPIAHSVVLSAIRKCVKGFELDPFGRFLFEKVDLGDG